MNTMQEWIAHLQHPLVLTGFGLFVFAVLLPIGRGKAGLLQSHAPV